MKISLRKGILSLSIISTVLTACVIILISMFFQNKIKNLAKEEVDKMTYKSIRQLSFDLYDLCASIDQASSMKINNALVNYNNKIKNLGSFSITPLPTQQIKLSDNFGKELGTDLIPSLSLNGVPFAQIYEQKIRTGLVDDLKSTFPDLYFSVFVKSNSSGDMVCVSSNLPKSIDERAVGLKIPNSSNKSENSIVGSILKKGSFHNVSSFYNKMYISQYEPIKSINGEVIGMLVICDPLSSYSRLQKMVDDITIGETGYAVLISGDNLHPGLCVVSKNAKVNGKDLWNVCNKEGVYPVRNGIKYSSALANKSEDSVYIDNYNWVNPDGEEFLKAAYDIYYKPWNVMSSVTFYEYEMQKAQAQIEKQFNKQTYISLAIALALVLIIVYIAILLTRVLVKPINHIKQLALLMADGEITKVNEQLKEIETNENNINFKNEIQTLEYSFAKMLKHLSSLIYQVHKSGIEVSSSTAQISASARQLEAAVAENAASTKEVSATSKVIADSSEKLADKAVGISDEISNTVELAKGGQENLQMMNSAMSSIVKAASSISGNLNNINKKANDISGIIKTIDKISDNTTLLSLNAAIQAEKAGDQGKGFSVIARKINELADQTNIATKDIEFMVKQMQSSVAAGVMEMDKFGKEVQKNSEDIFILGNQLAEIINRINGILPVILDLKDNMHYQANDANQISEAIEQLDIASRQTKEALQEFNFVAEKLNKSAQGLHSEVSVFKV